MFVLAISTHEQYLIVQTRNYYPDPTARVKEM